MEQLEATPILHTQEVRGSSPCALTVYSFSINRCQLRERLAHHAKLRLAVELEDLGIALPQHLRHHVVGDAARAEPGCEGVPKLAGREILQRSPASVKSHCICVHRSQLLLRAQFASYRFERLHSDSYLDAGAKTVQNRHQPVSGKPCEVGAPNAGEVGRGESGSGMGGADGQFFPVECLDDPGG
jgi:hypothetical protein